jgi:hypothetical protein
VIFHFSPDEVNRRKRLFDLFNVGWMTKWCISEEGYNAGVDDVF